MCQCQYRRDRKLPFKPEPNIDHDRQKGTGHRQHALFGEFSPYGWANKFSAAHIISIT